jgi:hypothetical protein
MLYPEGNTHIGDVAGEYRSLLQADVQSNFIPMTYRSFLQACRAKSDDAITHSWLDWCERRYEL